MLLMPDQTINLFQVCLSMQSLDTRRREIAGLEDAMKELNLKNACIITLEEEEKITSPVGEIEVVPAWKFFLHRSI